MPQQTLIPKKHSLAYDDEQTDKTTQFWSLLSAGELYKVLSADHWKSCCILFFHPETASLFWVPIVPVDALRIILATSKAFIHSVHAKIQRIVHFADFAVWCKCLTWLTGVYAVWWESTIFILDPMPAHFKWVVYHPCLTLRVFQATFITLIGIRWV